MMAMEVQRAMMGTAPERLRAFRTRSQEYLRLGHDRLAAARFVAGASGEFHGTALDIGTGKGLLAIELARRGMKVISVDVDSRERELAQLLSEEAGVAGRISFEQIDAAHIPYADAQFGCVAMMDVLHHLAEPGPVLSEMARVVGVGGMLVIADFNEQGFELVSRVHRAEGREHPRTTATVAVAMKELMAAGFRCAACTNGHQHDVVVLQKQVAQGECRQP